MAEKSTYRYKDFFLPQGQMSRSEHRRLWNFYKRYCLEMGDYYGEGHWILLCHAAFPVLLTPDLLYKIWMNFSSYPEKEQTDGSSQTISHTIPYVAVSDLLLSSLCEEVGFEQFEISADIRFALLEWLRQDARFCDPLPEKEVDSPENRKDRISELANFLSAYLLETVNGTDPRSEAFREAQQWAITSYYQPDAAIRKMYEEFLDANIHKNKRKQLRLNRAIEQLQRQYSLRIQVQPDVEQAEKLKHLLEYSRGNKNLMMGRTQEAIAAFRKLPSLKDAPAAAWNMVNKTLSFPSAIDGEAIRPVSEDDYDGEQIYALLVGIDIYEDPQVTPLSSCVKDTHAVGEYLRKHHFEKDLRILKLTNEEATYNGVIEAFQTHFRKARSEDVILFYFAGHSNFFPTAPEFDSIFGTEKSKRLSGIAYPTAQESGLMLHDSRQDGTRVLSNLELIALLAESVKDDRNPNLKRYPRVVLLFDTDHSEHISKTPSIRSFVPSPSEGKSNRPLSSYLNGYYQNMLAEEGAISFSDIPYLLMGAAGEGTGAGETADGGIFTQHLLQLLAEEGGRFSYADIFERTRIKVQSSRDQIPIVIPYGGFDVNQGFLDKELDASQARKKAHIFFDKQKDRWMLEAGALHGFTKERLQDQPIQILQQNVSIADFHIAEVGLTNAELEPSSSNPDRLSLDVDQIYEIDIPSYPLRNIYGEQLVQSALSNLGLDIHWVNHQRDAEWEIAMEDDEYLIRAFDESGQSLPLGKSLTETENSLKKIATWQWIRNLKNPQNHFIHNHVEFSFEKEISNGRSSPLELKDGILDLELTEDESSEISMYAVFHEAPLSDISIGFSSLYVHVIELTNDFGMYSLGHAKLLDGERTLITKHPISFSLLKNQQSKESYIKCLYSSENIHIHEQLGVKQGVPAR